MNHMDGIQTAPGSGFVPVGERAQQLELIQHLQEFSELTVLVCGPSGVGKSALLKAVESALAVSHQIVFIQADGQSELELCELIAGQLGAADSSEIAIRERILYFRENDASVHVIVDDAHLLSSDALELLLDITHKGHGRWHLLLSGGEHFAAELEMLQQEMGIEHQMHNIALLGFSEKESQQFLSEIYRQQGMATLPISDRQLKKIWRESNGLPGVMLRKCLQLKSSPNIPYMHIAALLVIGFALLFSFVMQQNDTMQKTVVVTPDPVAELLAARQQAVADSALTGDNDTSLSLTELPAPAAGESVSAAEDFPATSASSEPVRQEEAGETPVIPPVVKVASTPTPKPVVLAKWQGTDVKAWLAFNPQWYAMQLLGARSKENAEQFIAQYKTQLDASKLTYYPTTFKGKPWYVVVYGPYRNHDAAEAAIPSLPASLRKQNPWIRPLANIQQDMRAQR